MKTFFHWGRNFLRRIEVICPEDTAKQPEIPQVSGFAKLHQRILDARRKKKSWKRN